MWLIIHSIAQFDRKELHLILNCTFSSIESLSGKPSSTGSLRKACLMLKIKWEEFGKDSKGKLDLKVSYVVVAALDKKKKD